MRGQVEGRFGYHLTEVAVHVALHFAERAFDLAGVRRPDGWSRILAEVPKGFARLSACSTRYQTRSRRSTWTLAMDVTAWLAAHEGREELRSAARHAALALAAGKPEHEIPWLRASVDEQMADLVELIMRRIRDKAVD